MALVLLKPKDVTLLDQDGKEHNFRISRLPAIAGREIVTQYPVSAIPRLGDYAVNQSLVVKLMGYVAVVKADGVELILSSQALIDNHVPDWETLAKLEVAMMEYNVSFFGNGRGLSFLDGISQQARLWITETLIPSLAQSLQKGKQP